MRSRAIADLAQLAEPALFDELSRGMRSVLANAASLIADATVLDAGKHHRAAALLLIVAEEEAAKYFVLLDAARCDRQGPNFARQLKRFNDHLAKGIYAEYAGIAPATFREVLNFVEHERRTLYLDGPNDVDWIFPNRILHSREELFYVDYVETDGLHRWIEPTEPVGSGRWFHQPLSYTMAMRLSEAGFDLPDSLSVIAELWRGVEFAPDDHWGSCHERNGATLDALNRRQLLSPVGAEHANSIAWDWLFPLHSVEMSRIDVPRSELEEIQRSWTPDY